MHWARMFSSGSVSPGLLVDAGEHPAEQVGGVAGVPLRAALGDELVDQVVHERLVLVELPLRPDPQPGLDRQLPHAASCDSARTRTIASTNGCGVSR